MTGIAGLTLGGWLNGKHGLACDNLISADVVTADGQLLRASEEENEDLFWGIRGGGGNFGVVTSFGYRLHPVGMVLGGGLSYPLSEAREVLRFYHGFASGCPDELSTVASLGVTPDGEGVVGFSVCYCGPPRRESGCFAPAGVRLAAGGQHPGHGVHHAPERPGRGLPARKTPLLEV